MPRKRYKPEEIETKLRQVDVLVSQGSAMAGAIRQIGVSEVTFFRWRQEFGSLKTDQVKRLKELELEASSAHHAARSFIALCFRREFGIKCCDLFVERFSAFSVSLIEKQIRELRSAIS
jgi:putative transposase